MAIGWQRVEGALIFIGALAMFLWLDGPQRWWAAVLLFFAPDLSFAGYLAGPRVGAVIYNVVHIYAFGVVIGALGMISSVPVMMALGALWLAHSGLDRALGYGLKLSTGFQDTHLGRIGRS